MGENPLSRSQASQIGIARAAKPNSTPGMRVRLRETNPPVVSPTTPPALEEKAPRKTASPTEVPTSPEQC